MLIPAHPLDRTELCKKTSELVGDMSLPTNRTSHDFLRSCFRFDPLCKIPVKGHPIWFFPLAGLEYSQIVSGGIANTRKEPHTGHYKWRCAGARTLDQEKTEGGQRWNLTFSPTVPSCSSREDGSDTLQVEQEYTLLFSSWRALLFVFLSHHHTSYPLHVTRNESSSSAVRILTGERCMAK